MYKAKLLLISLIFFSSTSFAKENKDTNFYLKQVISINKINDVPEKNKDTNFYSRHESKFSPTLGVGMGYYINNNSRVDLIIERIFFQFDKEGNNFNYRKGNTFTSGATISNRKAFGKSLMLNGYVDILDKNSFKVFIGAGFGVAKIKEKVTYLSSGNAITNNRILIFPLIADSAISKTMTKPAYSLMVGSSIKVNSKIHLELMYSWRDFGKTKIVVADKKKSPIKNPYKGHNLAMGLRFDI